MFTSVSLPGRWGWLSKSRSWVCLFRCQVKRKKDSCIATHNLTCLFKFYPRLLLQFHFLVNFVQSWPAWNSASRVNVKAATSWSMLLFFKATTSGNKKSLTADSARADSLSLSCTHTGKQYIWLCCVFDYQQKKYIAVTIYFKLSCMLGFSWDDLIKTSRSRVKDQDKTTAWKGGTAGGQVGSSHCVQTGCESEHVWKIWNVSECCSWAAWSKIFFVTEC